MTVDAIWCLLGSANWDVRSFRLNFELDLEVYHAGVVKEVNDLIAAQQGARLSPTVLAARSFPLRLRDGAARLMVPYL
jgi:cardiolipin synthase A/B